LIWPLSGKKGKPFRKIETMERLYKQHRTCMKAKHKKPCRKILLLLLLFESTTAGNKNNNKNS